MRASRFCKMLAMLGVLAAAVWSGPAAAADRTANGGTAKDKTESPEKIHERHVGCAAIAAAAVDETQMLASQSEKEKTKARTILTITRDKALATGKGLGLTPSDVEKAVARQKDGILKKVKQAEGPAAEKEKSDLGRALIACALVESLER